MFAFSERRFIIETAYTEPGFASDGSTLIFHKEPLMTSTTALAVAMMTPCWTAVVLT